MVADNWTKSAMRDGGVVAELLLSLKEADVTPVFLAKPAVSALRWGIRQPRSRFTRCDGPGGSGGGPSSPSAYADGYEATSRQINGSLAVGSKPMEVRFGSTFREDEKLKRTKVTHQIHGQPHPYQDSETSFLVPDLNMMPSQNDNLNHYFSPHVKTLYASVRIS
ncbi:hypothetical protein EUTSA_v10015313mg [Eutrema salsugineum]|uniref:Uncharacterized protein n=1 Tax=Eutrema salsugineum TaxID=72664 RepID=V4KT01_EUTSA|nr:uncharacterized protein LOC18019096 [Eutrema salsugineum]ESQ41055.1 hypothetical protein EUTSA_v10015313mg [Eutrema salsugineum]